MEPDKILRQRAWTDQELLDEGFRFYKRIKHVVLARELPPEEAPLKIIYNGDVLIATAGYMICFSAGWLRKRSLYDYFHWPVIADQFAELYREWDDPTWKPKWGEKHLMSLGCKPYYNSAGVWAKRLEHPQMILGLEHDKPFEVGAGNWLLIDSKGAPYWGVNKGFSKKFILD